MVLAYLHFFRKRLLAESDMSNIIVILKSQTAMAAKMAAGIGVKQLDWKKLIEFSKKLELDRKFL